MDRRGSAALERRQRARDESEANRSGDGTQADDGTVLAAHGETIGVATNNVAEYRALVAGLETAADLGVDEVVVVSDSELLVKQMRGEYRVKNEVLRELWQDANRVARRLRKVEYTAVRREHNELADRLVNEALDAVQP
jgi:ribonuclease HI